MHFFFRQSTAVTVGVAGVGAGSGVLCGRLSVGDGVVVAFDGSFDGSFVGEAERAAGWLGAVLVVGSGGIAPQPTSSVRLVRTASTPT